MLARSRDLVAGGAFLLALSVAMPAVAQGPERAATLPFVAPDGKHIVYVRDLPDKSAELVVIDAAGGNAHVVARDPHGTVMGDWTSGGRAVTYVMTANDTTTLYRVGVDGGTPVPMTRLVCRGLRLSNDGKRVEKVGISKQGDSYFAKRENEPSVYELETKPVEELQKAASEVKEFQPPKDQKKK